MKKILSLLAVILFAAISAYSQAPGIFNYQGVARNSVGNVLINQNIALRLTIHDVTPGGPVVYQESRAVTTNPFGLFNVQVGNGGGTSVTGTIAGVPWGVGNKYIQVEIDPAGGTSFINIGTAQIASVPYALFATLAGDLVLPFNKTQADAGTLFKITNSNTVSAGATALEGLTNSTAGNAYAIIGTVTSASPGGFSTGVRGINNGTGGLGIGVWGSQNGGGWGVYGTAPSGIGVNGASTSGFGVNGSSSSGIGVNGSSSTATGVFGTSNAGNAGRFDITNAANNTDALVANTNGGAASWAFRSTSTGLQGAGIFTYNNAAGAANTIRSTNNGSGAGISVTATGTGSAGLFSNTNAANGATTVSVSSNSTTGVGILSNVTGTGQVSAVSGFISTTTGGSAGVNGADFSSGGASGIEARTYAVLGQTGATGIAVGGYALTGGTALRGSGGGLTGFALNTAGNVRHTGINEGVNRILTTLTGTGDATWQDPSAVGIVTGTGVPTRVAFWNSASSLSSNADLFWDNVNNRLGIGTAAPAHKLHVVQTGLVSAGFFSNTNAANNAPTVSINTNSTSATALSLSGPGIWGSAMGITNTTSGMEWRTSVNGTTYTVTKIPGSTFSPLQMFSTGGLDFSNSASTSIMRLLDNTNVGIGTIAPTQRLHVAGTVRIQDGTEGVGKVFTDNGAGTGTGMWSTLAGAGGVTGTGVPTRVAFWNSASSISSNANLYWDNVSSRLGIGTATPAYPLEVVHGGATGIHVASTASFSVVDIDANSGDAALRFMKAGVGQWNIRNNPADNSLQIFELGGGGSRFVIQDATGFVGINQLVPAYELDVLNNGASGIRSKSTASFAVVDIDGASGDAALRFQNAGVNQWNIRNRPGDNYLEIFELGGGGSRFVIQDGTGFVGINQNAPAYELDVLNAGASGIRSKSSGTFSVVDIDGFNGDAALRFQKNGVNQWNIRNRPADNYLEIFELGGGGSRFVIQDGTGFVGINQNAPAYELDVLNAGASGIRSKSSGTFSVVDIDGFNGDAALRFQKNGVNQWNIRNRPADNYLEIFELGGGGSRFVIQDATGFVGINQNAPAYELDVLNVGASGIRSKSSGTFTVIDIDGFNGDAALRFQNAGANQWNIRNNPANNDLQFFELGASERMRIENTTGRVFVDGNLHVNGTLSKTAGAFKIDHPLDPENKYLWHSFVESPDMMNIYNGNIVTDASGKATVQLPDYFEALNMEFRYQLTVIGTFAQAIINKEVSNNKFEIATNQPNVKVSWQVTGIRHDAYAQKNRIPNVVEKEAENKGKYLTPAAFNQPDSKGIGYTDLKNGVSSLNYVAPVENKAAPATTGGSLDQPKIAPSTNKVEDNSGSVAPQTEVKKAEVKPVDISGSVAPQTEIKKAVVKPVEVKGTSLEDLPKKAVEEKKKPSTVPESTKTD